MKKITPFLLVAALTACGQSETPQTPADSAANIPTVEEVAANPERLKELRQQCKTDRLKLGDVIGTVTEPVYDTATGKFLLIPQGSRILGRYNSQVSYGQSRVQVVWNRIILPDTSSLTLDNLVGTDPAGYAGQEDSVDYHWGRIFAGAALTTLLGVGAELAAPENRQDGNRIVIAGRDSAQDNINQVGQEITRRNMNIQPTLTSRPGLPVRIIVNRDLVLRPYQPLFFNRGASQ